MRCLDSRCPNRGITARLKHICICSYALQEVISEVRELFSWHLRWEVATGSRSGRCPVLADYLALLGGNVWECHAENNCRHFHSLCTLLYLCLLPVYNCEEDTTSIPFKEENLTNLFLPFFLEDEEDEEMVEPKAQDDLETENQDQKQEVKEGTLRNEKYFVTALKGWILQLVIFIGRFDYWEHCKIKTVTSFTDSEPFEWHKSRKLCPSNPAGRSEKLVKGSRLWLFRSYMSS